MLRIAVQLSVIERREYLRVMDLQFVLVFCICVVEYFGCVKSCVPVNPFRNCFVGRFSSPRTITANVQLFTQSHVLNVRCPPK